VQPRYPVTIFLLDLDRCRGGKSFLRQKICGETTLTNIPQKTLPSISVKAVSIFISSDRSSEVFLFLSLASYKLALARPFCKVSEPKILHVLFIFTPPLLLFYSAT
jgi:hypothetical protein